MEHISNSPRGNEGVWLPQDEFDALTEKANMVNNSLWTLIERYVEYGGRNNPPDHWICVFKREDTILKVNVPEDVWRAFDE